MKMQRLLVRPVRDSATPACALSTWDGLALRLCGAAAVALGFHAWRHLLRPRPPVAFSEDVAAAAQPLIVGEDEPEAERKGPKAAGAEPAAAAVPSPSPVTEPVEERSEAGGATAVPSLASAAPPTPVQPKSHAGGGLPAVDEQPAAAQRQVQEQHAVPAHAPHPAAEAAAAVQEEVQQPLEAAGQEEHAPAVPQHKLHVPPAAPLEPPLQHTPQPEHALAQASASPQPQAAAAVEALQHQLSAPEQRRQEEQQWEHRPELPGPAALAAELPYAAAAGEQQDLLPLPHAPEGTDDLLGSLEAGEQGELSQDPTDVAAVPLGSPFVPPALGAPPATPAIPLFSSFVPPAPLAAAGEAGAAPEFALGGGSAQSSPYDAAGSSTTDGSSPEGGGRPRHTRGRSLPSEGLAEQSPSAAGQATAQEEHRLLGEFAGLRQDAGAAASGQAAATAGGSAGAAPEGPPGWLGELRVELPAEHAEAPPAAAAVPSAPADLARQHAGPAHHSELLPGVGGHFADTLGGIDLQRQEATAGAATAFADYFTLPSQPAPARSSSSGGVPTPNSVAAALQRAVELAASGSGSLLPAPAAGQAAGPAGPAVGFAGFQGPPPPGAFPAAWPPGGLHGYSSASGGSSSGAGAGGGAAAGWPVGPGAAGGGPAARGPLTGGTFRSATVPAPIGQHGHAGGDSAWGDTFSSYSMLAERSASIQRERHLPRLSEEVEAVRASMDVDVPLACKLDVVAGPCTNASYTNTEDVLEIIIGRNQDVTMQLNDGEVSGQHAAVRWSSVDKCWKVADLGSLNGTLLNGEPISVAGRKRGRDYRLSSDDILQAGGRLGSYTKLKVSTFPRDLLDPLQSRCGSLPVGSMPRSLTMPKHRIPSFTSLLSPKITNTPSKKATVAAASDELRLECCIVSRTGRDHQRKGQTCEDVACAECPLHGSEAALGGNPAALFCVFDGHCGRGAADAASTALPDEVAKRLEEVRQPLADAAGAEDMLHRAFLAADEAISAEEGCTATAVLMWRDGQGDVCLQAANVGDSAALFIDPVTGRATELTEDHRLTNPRERQRLQDMGIQLASNARRLYGLNLCRGLGDKFLKDEDLGLSADPYVSAVIRLGEQQGGILLIASDGLWDVTDAEAVTATVCQADKEQDGSVLETTNAVIAHALKQRTKDDVTVLVVRVWPASEWELRSPTKNLDDGEVAAFVSS
ncbi:hypothetical protein ABPG77_000468 [Micractinium sp. CCAP 211/92]